MVERRDLTQWFYKITDYAQRLLDDMDTLEEWPERVLTMQRNWIGRSEGAKVTFTIEETGDEVEIFTTRPDTLWGVTFFVFSVEHPLVKQLAELGGTWSDVEPLIEKVRNTPLTFREQADTKEGVPLGVHAINPVNGERIPCFVAPYVLMEYGTGAIMAVPAHDERDFAFAREHDLPIRVVIQPEGQTLDPGSMDEAYPGEGVMVNSGPFDGEPTPASIAKVAAWLRDEGRGERHGHVPAARLVAEPSAVLGRTDPHHPLRRRAARWPCPTTSCRSCCPTTSTSSREGSRRSRGTRPGRRSPCPTCGGEARRDTDTMDTFVDSSWYFFRYCSPGSEDGPFRREDIDVWMPADQYTGGVEHAILHLMYCRFFTKALYDFGLIGFIEPFPRLMNQGQVIYGGASMSKTKGNIVEPMSLIERWGSDSLRLIMLFAGPFEDDIDWKLIAGDPNKRPGRERLAGASLRGLGRGGGARRRRPAGRARAPDASDDQGRDRGHGAVPVQHGDLQAAGADERDADGAGRRAGALAAATVLAPMLAPFAPFAAEELWREVLGNGSSVHVSSWPTYDPSLAAEDTVTLIVQVDGKVRDKIEVPVDSGRRTLPRAGARVGVRATGDRRHGDREGDRPRAQARESRDGSLIVDVSAVTLVTARCPAHP